MILYIAAMVALVQRVRSSRVEVDGKKIGEIERGINCLLGIERGDTIQDMKWVSDKIVNLRIFEDQEGRMNLSLLDIRGEILVVPQFTLLGDCRKGRRPNFTRAAPPHEAQILFLKTLEYLRAQYPIKVEAGAFKSMMVVFIENDGPVTFILNSRERG